MAYKMQIDKKLKNKEVISGVDYLVIADTIGPKIGCGGATMNVISELKSIYGESFKSLYVLVINAGGFSQRLPSSSALGKIFMALPFGNPMWSLFDLKLASYIPFLQRMKPGIFHAASDTIELFHINGNSRSTDWNFNQKGLTAVAHPSPVEIGVTHGVFVPTKLLSFSSCVMFLDCCEVLQKPSLETLEEKCAIMKIDAKDSLLREFVYTDSCFFVDQEFIKELGNFYEKEKPLTCEIDAYGDFMRCLGQNSSPDFKNDFKNVLTSNANLILTREKLYEHLHTFNLNVLAFNDSQFFHLGTMREYIENLSQHGILFEMIGWQQQVLTSITDPNSQIEGSSTSMHSFFEEKVTTGTQSVIEYCHFACNVDIGSLCIVSNCSAKELPRDTVVTIPSKSFVHTVPIADENGSGYVTIIYGIDDDIKKSYTNPKDILYLGKPLKDHSTLSKLSLEGKTLWSAELFPCLPDPTGSLLASLNLTNPDVETFSLGRYSASSVMQHKDVKMMLQYRQSLYDSITLSNGDSK